MLEQSKLIERFWANVPPNLSNSVCWNWSGNKNKAGYGRIWCDGKNTLAHRVAFLAMGKEIPSNKIACHTCDNPSCVNPQHLYVGDHSDNAKDAINRGLCPLPPRNDNSGENHGLSKLTWKIVREIREIYKKEKISQLALGKIYGVSASTIGFIVTGKRWKE